MIQEVEATVSFPHWKRGEKVQVDIHDPQVARLLRARYLKVNWKEDPDATPLGNPADPDWADCLFGSGVDAGAVQEAEAQVDGAGADLRVKEDSTFS